MSDAWAFNIFTALAAGEKKGFTSDYRRMAGAIAIAFLFCLLLYKRYTVNDVSTCSDKCRRAAQIIPAGYCVWRAIPVKLMEEM